MYQREIYTKYFKACAWSCRGPHWGLPLGQYLDIPGPDNETWGFLCYKCLFLTSSLRRGVSSVLSVDPSWGQLSRAGLSFAWNCPWAAWPASCWLGGILATGFFSWLHFPSEVWLQLSLLLFASWVFASLFPGWWVPLGPSVLGSVGSSVVESMLEAKGNVMRSPVKKYCR